VFSRKKERGRAARRSGGAAFPCPLDPYVRDMYRLTDASALT
jgi:hypothetical protein